MSPHWHEGPLDALVWDGASPVIWRTGDPGRGRRQPLVALLLAHMSGAEVRLARNGEGKPEVLSPHGWYVSLSGRGGLCLIAAAQSRQWLRRWTIKEAHAKLIGTPRRIAPEAIDTRLIDPVRAAAHHEGVSQCWTREQNDAIETVALWQDAA